jgi:multiple sugar transport system substrate-binding protein
MDVLRNMPALFAALGLVALAGGLGTYLSYPDQRSALPVLYWVTDNNPARERQIDVFHRWQIDAGHGESVTLSTPAELHAFRGRNWSPSLRQAIIAANDRGAAALSAGKDDVTLPVTLAVPAFELRLDVANSDTAKQVIQGVSGVGGDLMDIGGGGIVRYFNEIGLLEDVTDEAQRLGFTPASTYDAMASEISIDGRQFTFPCNVSASMLWVNAGLFKRLGIDPPPRRWTLEEFETIGKAFVAAANPEGQRQTAYFLPDVNILGLHRSMGLSRFDETLSGSRLDDPRYARALELKLKWTFEDHLLPSAAERDSFGTSAGYGGSMLQLFSSGNYAMFQMGRYALIQLRRFGAMDLAVVEPPHAEMPVVEAGTRCAGVYSAGDNAALAPVFLSYLASADYNHLIVDDGDALPPNPAYTESEAFRRPADYPNEWGVHEAFAEAAQTVAIGNAYSPFVSHSIVVRIVMDGENAAMNRLMTAEDAGREAARRIEDEIRRTLAENPALLADYEQRRERQARIDERRAAGLKVPLEWIDNPFYRRYYQFKGWAE